MMNRRTFLCGLTLGGLAMPLAAEAQTTGKPARIGVIAPGSPPLPHFEAFKQRRRDIWYLVGQTIVFETRWYD